MKTIKDIVIYSNDLESFEMAIDCLNDEVIPDNFYEATFIPSHTNLFLANAEYLHTTIVELNVEKIDHHQLIRLGGLFERFKAQTTYFEN